MEAGKAYSGRKPTPFKTRRNVLARPVARVLSKAKGPYVWDSTAKVS